MHKKIMSSQIGYSRVLFRQVSVKREGEVRFANSSVIAGDSREMALAHRTQEISPQSLH